MRASAIAHGIGTGLLAGLAGTAASTVSSKVEARLRRRHAPPAAGPVAKTALGIERFDSPAAEARFARLAHAGIGAGWGVLYGILRGLGLGPRTSAASQFGAAWGSTLVLLPKHDVAPPIFMRSRSEVAAEVWHHVVYAAATGVAYRSLDRRR